MISIDGLDFTLQDFRGLCKTLEEFFSLPFSLSRFSGTNLPKCLIIRSGAGEGIRTLDINLGKVALYQLSYARMN